MEINWERYQWNPPQFSDPLPTSQVRRIGKPSWVMIIDARLTLCSKYSSFDKAQGLKAV